MPWKKSMPDDKVDIVVEMNKEREAAREYVVVSL